MDYKQKNLIEKGMESMGIIKGILKVGASAVLTVTGTASAVLNGVCETAGVEIGAEIFGAAKEASFNGIKNMWNIESSQDEEYMSEEEAEETALSEEKRKLKVQALRCKELTQKATTDEMRQKFMDRYEELMDQANNM